MGLGLALCALPVGDPGKTGDYFGIEGCEGCERMDTLPRVCGIGSDVPEEYRILSF